MTQRGAEDDEDALDQLRLQTGLAGGRVERDQLFAVGQQLLDEAEGEAALAPRPLQLLQRVAALAHPCDDARLRRRRGRPAPPADRQDPLLRPALQRARRDAGAARGLAEGDPLVGHRWPRG
jgi:hypothetical protein